MDKEKQKQLIIEIMNEDAKDGLYKKQTALQFFLTGLVDLEIGKNVPTDKVRQLHDLFNQAKQMEKEQIVKAWDDGDYAYFSSKETGIDFENGEQYYNEEYGK